MAKITIQTTKGDQQITGRKFSHVVGGESFNFGFHKSFDHVKTYQVTHMESGKRVCFVPAMSRVAALGDDILAARGEIDKLVARVGEARARSVLAGA